ncbi:MAG TPA: zinc ABC transporter substrate-binding protein [Thermoleophilia bacterium]|nr:zinc ABC transporter substrate-binding protein [Thermoleophilia bacterium]
MKRRAPLLLLAAALLLPAATLAVGCGTATTSAGGGALDVVASVSYLADIAQNVAGDRFEVRSLVPLETDPHAFEPTPSDLGEVAGADVVIVNGGGLEGPLLGTLENAGGDATIVEASAGLESRRPQPGEPPLDETGTDPHFWLDPTLVKTYVENIRDAFAEADPAGAAEYEANAAAYSKKLDELDAWIETQIAQIPPADRKLVVNHASHGYFADRYGLEIVGAVIPGTGTGAAPTAKQLTELTTAIRSSGAKAIFVEIDENPELAQQIAGETGATVVTDLLDHSLSEPGGVASTYIEMMKYDTRRIVEAIQ